MPSKSDSFPTWGLSAICLRTHDGAELSPDVSFLGCRWNIRDKPLRMMQRRPCEGAGLPPAPIPLAREHSRHRGQTGSGSEQYRSFAKKTSQTSQSILEPEHRKSSPSLEVTTSLSVADPVQSWVESRLDGTALPPDSDGMENRPLLLWSRDRPRGRRDHLDRGLQAAADLSHPGGRLLHRADGQDGAPANGRRGRTEHSPPAGSFRRFRKSRPRRRPTPGSAETPVAGPDRRRRPGGRVSPAHRRRPATRRRPPSR